MTEGTSQTVALAVDRTLDLIAKGTHTPGSRLPGERSLSGTIGVSRTTVRAALRRLEEQGVVQGHPQRGWYVLPKATVSDRSTELESFTEIARHRGFLSTAEILAFRSRVASIDEAEELDIPPAASVIELTRLRKLDGIPICIDASVLVDRLCHPILETDFSAESLYTSLQSECGLTIYRSSCTLQARQATATQAQLLGLSVADPVLEVSATSSTLDGTIVLTSVVTYRGDSYRFQAELYRSSPFV